MKPTSSTNTPYMTVMRWRNDTRKVHRLRAHAHNAISQASREYHLWDTIDGQPIKHTVRKLHDDVEFYRWNGAEWKLIWSGKRGDQVNGKPWTEADEPEPFDPADELMTIVKSSMGRPWHEQVDAILKRFTLTPKTGRS